MPLEVSALQQIHKEKFKEQRDEVAGNITQERAQYFQEKQRILDKQKTLAEKLFQKQEELKSLQQENLEFSNKRTSRSESILSKVMSVFGKDKRLDYLDNRVAEAQTQIAQLERDIRSLESEIQQNNTALEQVVTNKNNLTNKVETFYDETSYDFLTPEQKKELFTADNLKSLNTAEYMELWRAGSPFFLAHVSREGFRDHASTQHTRNLGVYNPDFTRLLADNKNLQSRFYTEGIRLDNETTFINALKKWGVFEQPTVETAFQYFKDTLDKGIAEAPRFADKSAVHLSVENVIHDFYGGERGNEIFFIFPSDFIGSQHAFGFPSWHKDLTSPHSERDRNDIFIWKDEGINLDTGLVFLPKNTLVDRKTGSKYASVQDRQGNLTLIENESAQTNIREWWQKNKAYFSEMWQNSKIKSYYQRDDTISFPDIILDKLSELGFQGESFAKTVEDAIINNLEKNTEDLSPTDIDIILNGTNLNYKLAEDTVRSEEYWEAYFTKNPDHKPKHIVYYSGPPNKAIDDFLQSHNVTSKKSHDPLLGFDDNHVTNMKADPRSNPHYDETVAMGKRLIEENFSRK